MDKEKVKHSIEYLEERVKSCEALDRVGKDGFYSEAMQEFKQAIELLKELL